MCEEADVPGQKAMQARLWFEHGTSWLWGRYANAAAFTGSSNGVVESLLLGVTSPSWGQSMQRKNLFCDRCDGDDDARHESTPENNDWQILEQKVTPTPMGWFTTWHIFSSMLKVIVKHLADV